MGLIYKLHPKQGLAFQSKATEILFGGAAFGGKSHLLRVAAIVWSAVIPGLQTYLFRRLYPDLLKNHMHGPTSFPALLSEWVDQKLVRINYSDNIIRFWTGSEIHLCHCQYEKDRYKYQGAEIHLLLIDELTHFTKVIYAYLRSRVRLGGLKLQEKYKGLFPRIINGSNPGNIGHNWVKMDFVDLQPPYTCHDAPEEDGGMLRQYIPSLLEDNPTAKDEDPNYEKRLQGLGRPELVKAMRWGIWDIVAGGMFDDVWDPRIHILNPFDIPATWYLDRSFDWGSTRPYAVCWWAESDGSDIVLNDGSTQSTKKGDLFLFAERYGWNGKPDEGTRELATEVARRIKSIESQFKRTVHAGPADSAIYDTQNGMCIADDMARLGVTWTKADKSPGSRINSAELFRQRLKNSITREDPGLYIFETCRHFIRTVPVLPRDEKKPEDVDSSAEDHVYDAARYRIFSKRHSMTVRQAS
ncbi:MAG: terminase family protein [Sedimentisphaerales bacterium]|nr:terminase family protein [Sedimentisphaerales bacterium]